MAFLAKNAKLVGGLIIVIILVITHILAYWAGGDGCEVRHATKQLERNKELRSIDERIDREAPDGSDKRDAVDWLLNHTR